MSSNTPFGLPTFASPLFHGFYQKKQQTERKKKSQGLKQGLKKDGKAKTFQKNGISQKLHLPRSRIHRSRCRSRSRYLPWPAVTQRPLRSLRSWNGMIKRDEELQNIELCNFCYMFHQFSRFFQHISLIWYYIWSISIHIFLGFNLLLFEQISQKNL